MSRMAVVVNVLTPEEAAARRLVTRRMVMLKYDLSASQMARVTRRNPLWPEPVGRLAGTFDELYPADPILEIFRQEVKT